MRGAGAFPLAAAAIYLAGYRGHYLPRASALEAPPGGTSSIDVCESRTINYITHTLPQLCLKTSWSSANSTNTARANVSDDTPSSAAAAAPGGPEPTAVNLTQPEQKTAPADRDDAQDLATSSFMSFEEWKALQLKKAGQDVADLQARKRQERDPSAGHDLDSSLGDEGEIDLNFDVLSEKVSEMASPPSASSLDAAAHKGEGKKDEAVLYDDGTTRYYRSKDAGRTCKERFSYASFDGGATILKNSKGAKNAKAILVENKDSYMLLECGTDNKFVIVELSEDILVDTVVLANFEFFSSMIRQFRVSVSDRWPVKMDKWKDLGTFEARNSRDIQAFLIEHPQIWAKYIRVEFLSHYGNEFYCPVSLLRVHGTRMLDSWKETEAGGDDEDETIDAGPAEPAAPAVEGDATASQAAQANVSEQGPADEIEYDSEVSLSPWHPFFYMEGVNNTCWTFASPVVGPSPAPSAPSRGDKDAAGPAASSEPSPGDAQASMAAPSSEPVQAPAPSAVSAPASEPTSLTSAPAANAGAGAGTPASSIPQTTTDTTSVHAGEAASPSQPGTVVKAPASESSPAPSPPSAARQASSKASSGGKPPPTTTTTTVIPKSSTPPSQAKNRTASASNPVASPTVQESFFKSVTKRLQFLESNTSLSLQYIEDQSRFLQEALGKMERKQMARVDSFLDTLNNTVLSELRNVRTQYDQIWQSTVIALESQREQSQREVAALGDRLNVLADEVVFQKRMAILQSVLLLACLVLVIFSRGIVGATPTITFDGPSSSALLSSPSLSGALLRSDSTAYATDSPSPSPLRRGGVVKGAAAGRPPAVPRSQSYPDKVLPLTPTSDYSRDDASPPPLAPPLPPPVAADGSSTADDPSQSSSSYYADEDEAEEPGALFTPPSNRLRPESRQETPNQQGSDAATAARNSLLPSPLSSRSGSVEHVDSAESGLSPPMPGAVATLEANYSSDSIETARSLLSHTSMGSMRKPLPALPEDPS